MVRAISWPALAFWSIRKFAPEIQKLLRRIKSAKFPGGAAEFDKELDQLGAKVDEAQAELAAQPPQAQLPPAPPPPETAPGPAEGQAATSSETGAAPAVAPAAEGAPQPVPEPAPDQKPLMRAVGSELGSSIPADVQAILLQASTSPKMALIQLAIAIETEMRRFLHATGWHKQVRSTSPPIAIDTLAGQLGIPQSLATSVKDFWQVRNKIVHGHVASDDATIRAIDLGVRIFRTLRQVPREINIVYHPGTEVFADAAGTQLREGVRAVVLKTTQTDGKVWLRVFPTTKQDYKVGDQVSWEWSFRGPGYGKSWYRHPDTGKVEPAWDSSAEFIGRSLDSV